ncbi:MAG: hypothetical protein V3V14_03090 [Saprospiraceae bacterium]
MVTDLLGKSSTNNLFAASDQFRIIGSAIVEEGVYSGKLRIKSFNQEDGSFIGQNTVYADDPNSKSLYFSCSQADIIYAVGVTYDEGGTNSYDILVVAFSKDNEVLWIRRIGEAGRFERGYNVTIDNENNLVVGGIKAIEVESNSYNPWLLKFDINGELLWDKTFVGLGNRNNLVSLSTDSENNIYALVNNKPNLEMTVSKFTSSGDSLWTQSYLIEESPLGKEIKMLKNDEFIISGNAIIAPYTYRIPIYLKIDKEGNKLWSKEYAEVIGGASYESFMKITSDQKIAKVYDSKGYPTLMIIDTEGNVEYTREYSQVDHFFSINLVELDDGSFIILGYISSNLHPENHTFWLLRTDQMVTLRHWIS